MHHGIAWSVHWQKINKNQSVENTGVAFVNGASER